MDTRSIGGFAEDYAVKLLRKNGYSILKRNFRTKHSEVDILAENENYLVFVEVKARWGKKFGAPEEAVTSAKLRKIIKAGELFWQKHPDLPRKMRVDVVSLVFDNEKCVSEKIIKVF